MLDIAKMSTTLTGANLERSWPILLLDPTSALSQDFGKSAPNMPVEVVLGQRLLDRVKLLLAEGDGGLFDALGHEADLGEGDRPALGLAVPVS